MMRPPSGMGSTVTCAPWHRGPPSAPTTTPGLAGPPAQARYGPTTITQQPHPEAAGRGAAPPGAVREEQVRLLYRFSLIGYLATLLVVFVLGAILWEELAQPALFAWFGAISAVTLGRYALYKVFINREPPGAELPRWERRFLAGSLLAALCWAAIASGLFPDTAHLARRLTVALSHALFPCFSPDGSRLAFSARDEGPVEILSLIHI